MAVPNDVVEGELIEAATFNAILAELRKMPQSGESSIALSAAAAGSVSVTFPVAFSTAPVVVPGVKNSTVFNATVSSVTTTGCVIEIRHTDNSTVTATIPVTWVAQLATV